MVLAITLMFLPATQAVAAGKSLEAQAEEVGELESRTARIPILASILMLTIASGKRVAKNPTSH